LWDYLQLIFWDESTSMVRHWNIKSCLGNILKWFKFLEFIKNENCNDRGIFPHEFWFEFKDCQLIKEEADKNNNIRFNTKNRTFIYNSWIFRFDDNN
jgi:hypothetical protein